MRTFAACGLYRACGDSSQAKANVALHVVISNSKNCSGGQHSNLVNYAKNVAVPVELALPLHAPSRLAAQPAVPHPSQLPSSRQHKIALG